jgi:ribosome-binding factor A
MSGIRRERIQGQVLRELSDIIQNKLKDPRRGWLNITRVEMSSDLRYAKVYVSSFGAEDRADQSLGVLRGAAAFLRGELGRRLKLRHSPELTFHADRGLETSRRVLDILESLEIPAEDSAGDQAQTEDGRDKT